jgi:hypothetical protein
VLRNKTCAENSEQFFTLSRCFQNFQHNSGETMHQNSATIKDKILTKHGNDPARLQYQTTIPSTLNIHMNSSIWKQPGSSKTIAA